MIEPKTMSVAKDAVSLLMKSGSSDEEKLTQVVENLIASDIDPVLFDTLLSNEMDRKLKTRFAYIFLVLATVVTAISYAIIVLNSTQHWGIPEAAITGLIIETPMQFIGILYIIARNLFPQRDGVAK